jgi:hypothetical protein
MADFGCDQMNIALWTPALLSVLSAIIDPAFL